MYHNKQQMYFENKAEQLLRLNKWERADASATPLQYNAMSAYDCGAQPEPMSPHWSGTASDTISQALSNDGLPYGDYEALMRGEECQHEAGQDQTSVKIRFRRDGLFRGAMLLSDLKVDAMPRHLRLCEIDKSLELHEHSTDSALKVRREHVDSSRLAEDTNDHMPLSPTLQGFRTSVGARDQVQHTATDKGRQRQGTREELPGYVRKSRKGDEVRKVLEELFHLPQKAAARKCGMGLTAFKALCREHNVVRWPVRKIVSLERKQQGTQSAYEAQT